MTAASAKGYLCVLSAAVMWASSGTVAKALFIEGITPFELVQIRVTLAAFLLALLFGLFAPSSADTSQGSRLLSFAGRRCHGLGPGKLLLRDKQNPGGGSDSPSVYGASHGCLLFHLFLG